MGEDKGIKKKQGSEQEIRRHGSRDKEGQGGIVKGEGFPQRGYWVMPGIGLGEKKDHDLTCRPLKKTQESQRQARLQEARR